MLDNESGMKAVGSDRRCGQRATVDTVPFTSSKGYGNRISLRLWYGCEVERW